jgi:hypothetical protein
MPGLRSRRAARACPECGADERTGWNEEATRYDGLDLPEEAFGEEDAPPKSRRGAASTINGAPIFWWLVGVGLLALMVWALVA